ncbi:MAG: STAS domain-containing protein [Acidimicrobiales bacterium]|nr:STAS domain-containing protein [Acidimicrobiales bacterium]
MHHHPLTIEVRPEQSSVTLFLSGELDLASAGSLRACFEGLDARFRSIVVDLSDLTFLDSTGLGLLVQAQQRFGPEFRELALRNPLGNVRHVLAISGVDQVVPILTDPQQAVAAG